MSIKQKYQTKAAALYRDKVKILHMHNTTPFKRNPKYKLYSMQYINGVRMNVHVQYKLPPLGW